MNIAESSLKEINDLMRVLEKLEDKKNLCLKKLNISGLREITNQQEKIIQKIISNIKNYSIKKIPIEKFSSLMKKHYVNKAIILNFKTLSEIYFKPFQNPGYKRNGETKEIHLKSVSLTT